MRKRKLIGGTVLTPIRALAGAEIAVENGKIVSVGPRDAATDAGAEIFDVGGSVGRTGLYRYACSRRRWV